MSNSNFARRLFAIPALLCCVAVAGLAGCSPPDEVADKKDGDGPIFNQTTQDIGEFNANDAVVEDNGDDVNLVTGALGAYTPTISTIAKLQIKQSVNLFQAEHGRFPKDHEEFMSEIITKYNVKLPKLPAKFQYKYDVENHELLRVAVEKETE